MRMHNNNQRPAAEKKRLRFTVGIYIALAVLLSFVVYVMNRTNYNGSGCALMTYISLALFAVSYPVRNVYAVLAVHAAAGAAVTVFYPEFLVVWMPFNLLFCFILYGIRNEKRESKAANVLFYVLLFSLLAFAAIYSVTREFGPVIGNHNHTFWSFFSILVLFIVLYSAVFLSTFHNKPKKEKKQVSADRVHTLFLLTILFSSIDAVYSLSIADAAYLRYIVYIEALFFCLLIFIKEPSVTAFLAPVRELLRREGLVSDGQ